MVFYLNSALVTYFILYIVFIHSFDVTSSPIEYFRTLLAFYSSLTFDTFKKSPTFSLLIFLVLFLGLAPFCILFSNCFVGETSSRLLLLFLYLLSYKGAYVWIVVETILLLNSLKAKN